MPAMSIQKDLLDFWTKTKGLVNFLLQINKKEYVKKYTNVKTNNNRKGNWKNLFSKFEIISSFRK
jgi:hypothetical protein